MESRTESPELEPTPSCILDIRRSCPLFECDLYHLAIRYYNDSTLRQDQAIPPEEDLFELRTHRAKELREDGIIESCKFYPEIDITQK